MEGISNPSRIIKTSTANLSPCTQHCLFLFLTVNKGHTQFHNNRASQITPSELAMLIQKKKNAKIILDQKDLRTTPRQAPLLPPKKKKKQAIVWVGY
jgi:hypothetical protein